MYITGDSVRLRDSADKTWATRCIVLNQAAPRSYNVRTGKADPPQPPVRRTQRSIHKPQRLIETY